MQNDVLIEPKSLRHFFLVAMNESSGEQPPITPFQAYIARMHGFDLAKDPHRTASELLFSLYSSFASSRAPYRFPVPPSIQEWFNTPVSEIRLSNGQHGYVTRLMRWAWEKQRRDLDLQQSGGYLRFLSWFAFECLPAWNTPGEFLPDSLIEILNEPAIDRSVPLTVGMVNRAEENYPQAVKDFGRTGELAISFLAVARILQSGDTRLLPEFVTAKWREKMQSADGLTSFEYLAARAFSPDLLPDTAWAEREHPSLVRTWFETQYLNLVPDADVLGSPADSEDENCVVHNTPHSPSPKVIFVYRDHHTVAGLSRAGRTTAEVLKRGSIPVVDIDHSYTRARIREEFLHNETQITYAESGVHLLNLNPEYVPECLLTHFSRIRSSDPIIGQFYWELSDIGGVHEEPLSLMTELWVASSFLRDVYSRRVRVPVHVMGQALSIGPSSGVFNRAYFAIPDDCYTFLFSFDAGSIVERKNPLGAVKAFRLAFPRGSEKVCLILKTMNLERIQTVQDQLHWKTLLEEIKGDSRIKVIDRSLTEDQLACLFDACDCYVSLHRSEGFGYGPAEGMARGKPVIVTNYSGVTDFCTHETALLVDYQLTAVAQDSYPYMSANRSYHWADPNVQTASHHMTRLFHDPESGAELGRKAQRFMQENYSTDALWRRYSARLSELGFA